MSSSLSGERTSDSVEPEIVVHKRESTFSSLMGFMMIANVLLLTFVGLYFSLGPSQILGIFTLHDDVLFALNMSFNIFVYVIPAFLSALLGSIIRILLSSKDSILSHFRVILGSGFIGVLTFIGLKSGLVLDLLAENVQVVSSLSDEHSEKLFYKFIVVCVITGMFATTMFLTIEERVNNLVNQSKNT